MATDSVDVFIVVEQEIQAVFRISGSLDPAILEEIFGAKVHARGGNAGTSVCEIFTIKERTTDAVSHVEALLTMVRPHLGELRALVVKDSLDVDVILLISGWPDGESLYLDAIRVAELASIGAGLEVVRI